MSAVNPAAGAQAPAAPGPTDGDLAAGYWWHVIEELDIAPSPAGAVTASAVVARQSVRALYGWALTETTGLAGAALRLRDGLLATDPVIARVNLSANESTREGVWTHGLRVRSGSVYLEVLSGSIEGTLWVR